MDHGSAAYVWPGAFGDVRAARDKLPSDFCVGMCVPYACVVAQSCYSGASNDVQYTLEHIWVDNAEDTDALRKALAHADSAAAAAAEAPVVTGADADGDVSMDVDANTA